MEGPRRTSLSRVVARETRHRGRASHPRQDQDRSALADKKEKRFLQGRLEAQLNHRERALELFQTILRRPEGASRAVLIATLCAVAETNLRLKTPEAGDDPLEDFVEHHPTDPELPTIFHKLDQLYRAQRTPSNQELRRWATDPIQPRRSLAQWYLARSELRAGRRENALKIFGELRDAHPQLASAGRRSPRVCATRARQSAV